jgi:FMN-dependent NADH-azoreductase
MAQLLHIDSSFTGDASVSRAVTREYLAQWQAKNPGGTVTYRDLNAQPPAHLDWTVVSAGFTPEDQRTPEQRDAAKARETYIGEVVAADEVLIAAPMYNFTIPSTLKSWLDQLIVPGRTLAGPDSAGLLHGKKVTIVTVQGGSYGPGAPKEGWDHATPYLTHVAEAFGADDVEFVNVLMALSLSNPALAQFKDLHLSSRAAATDALKARAHA